MIAGWLEMAESRTFSASSGAPALMPVRAMVCKPASSGRVRLAMLSIVGGELVGRMVTVNTAWVCAPCGSIANTVRTAVPERVLAGVMVTLRLAPAPSKVMFAGGMSVGLEDCAESAMSEGASSGSLTAIARRIIVSSMALAAPESWSVGGSLIGVTWTAKVRMNVLFVVAPSFTITEMIAVPAAFVSGAKMSAPVVLLFV